MKYLQIAKIVVIVLCVVLLVGAASMLVVSTNAKAENFFNDLFGKTETGSGSGAATEDPEETIPETDTLDKACVHEFDDGAVFKEKTCTSNGVIKYTCSKCEGIKYDVDPAAGHRWDDGKITVQGSCEEKQEIMFTCSACQSTKKVVNTEVHPSDSRYEVFTAFSTLKHEHIYKCGACDKVLKQEIVPHSWDDGEVTVQPTCEDGEMVYHCSCGVTKTVVIAGSGHNIEKTYQAETETKHSITETCTVCNKVLTTGNKTEPHSWNNNTCVKCGATR